MASASSRRFEDLRCCTRVGRDLSGAARIVLFGALGKGNIAQSVGTPSVKTRYLAVSKRTSLPSPVVDISANTCRDTTRAVD